MRNRIEQGRFTEHAHGLGTVTREMVRKRASEIAIINGRARNNILLSDFREALHELTGGERLMPHRTTTDRIPEENRWEAVAETQPHSAPLVPAPDEQTFAEELIEEGVADAEHDQMVAATRESLRREAA